MMHAETPAASRAVASAIAAVPRGRELVPLASLDGEIGIVLRCLQAVGLGAGVAVTWLIGGVLSLTPWWCGAWWCCKVVVVGMAVAWIVGAAGRAWRSARAWVPIVGPGGYSCHTDGARTWILCKRGAESSWQPLESFVARPLAPAKAGEEAAEE